MRAEGAAGTVVVYSQFVAFARSIPEGLVSLAVGLIGVALARWVFVNREYRRVGMRQGWSETLPLTLVAMLVAGVLIYDRQLGISASAFVGLGVGWVAVVLLDVFGDRILSFFRSPLQGGPADPRFPPQVDLSGKEGKVDSAMAETPQNMLETLAEIDRRERGK